MTEVTATAIEEIVVALECDAVADRNTPDFAAFTKIRHECGYDSAWDDGDLVECDICESCLKELLGSICRIKR